MVTPPWETWFRHFSKAPRLETEIYVPTTSGERTVYEASVPIPFWVPSHRFYLRGSPRHAPNRCLSTELTKTSLFMDKSHPGRRQWQQAEAQQGYWWYRTPPLFRPGHEKLRLRRADSMQ